MSRLLLAFGGAVGLIAVTWWRLGLVPASMMSAGLVFGMGLGILWLVDFLRDFSLPWGR